LDQLKAQEARASKTGETGNLHPHGPSAHTVPHEEALKALEADKRDETKPGSGNPDNKIPGPDFLQHQMTAVRSVLSPLESKVNGSQIASSGGPPSISAAELLTAKGPVPLGNAQDEKKQIHDLPSYAAQPPPMPTPTPTGRGRGRGRGRGSRGGRNAQQRAEQQQQQQQQQQNNPSEADVALQQHQAYMAANIPYSGYGGFTAQQIPGMAPGVPAFQPNPMMQPGAGMMPNMNPAQFPGGQFPPGSQFPGM